MNRKASAIAFYLPQYHPIPENDKWWGKGFTEWTNVAKAKPLFRGHYQPHIPADLGYYDLRVPETRYAQAEMAKASGIEGFCYWHYWFAGKRLLDRPFREVLESGKPDFPFCLAWANESWSGVWHGNPDRILMEQTYPGEEDYSAHFAELLCAFSDSRYITVYGKPLLVVYKPDQIPDSRRFMDYWRELAAKSGLKGLYIVGCAKETWDPISHGFDAVCLDTYSIGLIKLKHFQRHWFLKMTERIIRKDLNRIYRRAISRPAVYRYSDFTKQALPDMRHDCEQFPTAIANWDNTPRSGLDGIILRGSTPELFRRHLRDAIEKVRQRTPEKRIIFLKSWNEWAEGNYLEPDERFGHQYMDIIREEMDLA